MRLHERVHLVGSGDVGFDLTDPYDWREGLQADAARMAAFAGALAGHGVWVRSNGLFYVSLAHGEADLADTERAIAAAMRELASAPEDADGGGPARQR